MKPEVAVPRATLIRWARVLNLLVVSGDRMGSHYAEEALDELDREHGRWFRERDVWRELAQARSEVHDALVPDTVHGDEQLDAELGDIAFWRAPGD